MQRVRQNLEGESLSSISRDSPDFSVKIRITPLDAEADRDQVHINDWYLYQSNGEWTDIKLSEVYYRYLRAAHQWVTYNSTSG